MRTGSAIIVAMLVGLTSMSCSDRDPEPAPSPVTTAAPAATPGTQAPASGSLATAAAAAEACGFTSASTAGPYYVSGTRALTDGNLNYDDLDGTPIRIAGYVYGAADNSAPVGGAKIEIWQADNAGRYHPQGQGAVDDFSADEISLRGSVTSDDNGFYSFTSILPSEYGGRVRHIHVRATAPGHRDLISQIIVAQPGDDIGPEDDSVSNNFHTCSVVDFADLDGIRTAIFNFHIQ